MRFPVLGSLLILAPLLSGCIGGEGKSETVLPSESLEPEFGDIEGVVMDEEARPIPNVRVTVSGEGDVYEATTDSLGAWSLRDLAVGAYRVAFAHADYDHLTEEIVVLAETTIEPTTVLVLLPSRRFHEQILPEMRGHYDCAWEAVIFPGDCMILWEQYIEPEDPATKEDNFFFFEVDERWTQVVVELEWTSGGNNQLDGMRLYLAPAEESRNPSEHHTKMAVAEGPDQPLRIDLVSGFIHETAERFPDNDTYAQLSPLGGEVMVLGFPRGKLASETEKICDPFNPDRCFLGVGAALSLDFTVHVAVFYNGPAPDGFTMLEP